MGCSSTWTSVPARPGASLCFKDFNECEDAPRRVRLILGYVAVYLIFSKIVCFRLQNHQSTRSNVIPAIDPMSGSTSNDALGPTVIAADSSKPFTPGPVISELLRTRHCLQGSILLVEGIEAEIPISKRYRTVRLLLGDGDLCIQALLRMEMHRFVDHGSIFVGGYVQLNKFELRAIPTRASSEEEATGEGGGGDNAVEEMVFLVVWDMVTVGWNTAYMEMAGVTLQQPPSPPHHAEPKDANRGQTEDRSVDGKDAMHVDIPPVKRAATQPAPKTFRERLDADLLAGTNKGTSAQTRNPHAQQRQQQPTGPGPGISYSAGNTLPWTADDLSKPIKLTPLKSIPNLPYKQNWIVNILAVIASLSEVEAATLPPFKQRTARLADPSTSKQVLLTVFLNPDEFAPSVGSVVLLLGVKNHRFDGGCLKKYGNEKPKHPAGSTSWWFENPRDIAWCDVEGLRKWWAEKSRG